MRANRDKKEREVYGHTKRPWTLNIAPWSSGMISLQAPANPHNCFAANFLLVHVDLNPSFTVVTNTNALPTFICLSSLLRLDYDVQGVLLHSNIRAHTGDQQPYSVMRYTVCTYVPTRMQYMWTCNCILICSSNISQTHQYLWTLRWRFPRV